MHIKFIWHINLYARRPPPVYFLKFKNSKNISKQFSTKNFSQCVGVEKNFLSSLLFLSLDAKKRA
jgi:hypothetical protein